MRLISTCAGSVTRFPANAWHIPPNTMSVTLENTHFIREWYNPVSVPNEYHRKQTRATSTNNRDTSPNETSTPEASKLNRSRPCRNFGCNTTLSLSCLSAIAPYLPWFEEFYFHYTIKYIKSQGQLRTGDPRSPPCLSMSSFLSALFYRLTHIPESKKVFTVSVRYLF